MTTTTMEQYVTVSTIIVLSSGSNHCTIWIGRSSTGNQQSCDTQNFGKTLRGLIDVNGLGRPKEFSGKEEDFQQWSKKTEDFFVGVIKESEMMLEWAAEQTTEITMSCEENERHGGGCRSDMIR